MDTTEIQTLEKQLKDWLPTGDAMLLTGRSEAWLRRLRKEGRVRFLMHGQRVLWYRLDLEALGPKSKRGRPKKEIILKIAE